MEPLPGDRGHALLVSGAIGLGHDAMAQTCAASLASRGWSTQTADAMRLLGRRASGAGEQVFRSLLAVPGLYDAYYFAALRPGNRLALLTDAAARRRIVPALTRLLDQKPAQLAISVFATGASAVSAVAERYPAMRHVVFCARCHPAPAVGPSARRHVPGDLARGRMRRPPVCAPGARSGSCRPGPGRLPHAAVPGPGAGHARDPGPGPVRAGDVRWLGAGPGRGGGVRAGGRGRPGAGRGRVEQPARSRAAGGRRGGSRESARSATPIASRN